MHKIVNGLWTKHGMKKLDRIDMRILELLQQDGRVSNVELAQQVNLSASACLQRVKKLEQSGVITGYHARLNLKSVSSLVSVIALVTLRRHENQNFALFEKAVARIPEITECLKVSGEFDYSLRFECRDMESYHTLSESLLKEAAVANLNSHVIMNETKAGTGVNVRALLNT